MKVKRIGAFETFIQRFYVNYTVKGEAQKHGKEEKRQKKVEKSMVKTLDKLIRQIV